MLAVNEDLEWIKRRALEIAAEFDAKDGPYRAEIVPDASPEWYVARCAPGKEQKAVKYLQDRGLGVFLPQFIKGSRMQVMYTDVMTGRVVQENQDLSNKLVFPGRVFIFCWDILAHWRRVMACPGVQSIMVDRTEKPVIVRDAQMCRIQMLQYILSVPKAKKRKRYKAAGDDLITISTRSFWRVDGEERNRVLDQSLGAAS